jgi:hypothetical protein
MALTVAGTECRLARPRDHEWTSTAYGEMALLAGCADVVSRSAHRQAARQRLLRELRARRKPTAPRFGSG